MPVSLLAPQRKFPTLSVEICIVLGKSDQLISLVHSFYRKLIIFRELTISYL